MIEVLPARVVGVLGAVEVLYEQEPLPKEIFSFFVVSIVASVTNGFHPTMWRTKIGAFISGCMIKFLQKTTPSWEGNGLLYLSSDLPA